MNEAADNLAGDRPSGGWDPLVRITHWGIATAILLNALVTEEGGSWHVWVGTAMAGLLGLRILWGFIGPERARFRAFPPSPGRALAHVREILGGRVEQHPSHNGLGALMVYAIWATLAVVAATGFSMSGFPPAARAEAGHAPGLPDTQAMARLPAPAGAGQREAGRAEGRDDEEGDEDETKEGAERQAAQAPAAAPAEAGEGDQDGREAGEAGEGGEEWAEELHEGAVNLLYILIGLHILGVLLETMRAGPQVLGRITSGSSD